jgi:hypothetical protein
MTLETLRPSGETYSALRHHVEGHDQERLAAEGGRISDLTVVIEVTVKSMRIRGRRLVSSVGP